MATADETAARRLAAVVPQWQAIVPAGPALGLEGRVLLHCGPPADSAGELPLPIAHSAAVAAVFESWASDLDEGLELVRSGEVRFEAAQDHHCATPMTTASVANAHHKTPNALPVR